MIAKTSRRTCLGNHMSSTGKESIWRVSNKLDSVIRHSAYLWVATAVITDAIWFYNEIGAATMVAIGERGRVLNRVRLVVEAESIDAVDVDRVAVLLHCAATCPHPIVRDIKPNTSTQAGVKFAADFYAGTGQGGKEGKKAQGRSADRLEHVENGEGRYCCLTSESQ